MLSERSSRAQTSSLVLRERCSRALTSAADGFSPAQRVTRGGRPYANGAAAGADAGACGAGAERADDVGVCRTGAELVDDAGACGAGA